MNAETKEIIEDTLIDVNLVAYLGKVTKGFIIPAMTNRKGSELS